MKISLGLPTQRVDKIEEFGTGAAVAEMARCAEEAGFDAVYVTEHPVPGTAWMKTGGHHAFDPFVALSFAAAATTTLRVQTHLAVLPYRNPFLTAKAAASLDALSGGRLILGVGAGYLEVEYAALGVAFEERNDLTDEALVAMQVAWTGEPFSFDGRHFRAEDNVALPRPVQRPGPPVWIGGNARRAIRRAVELADGWAPMPNAAATAVRRHSPAMETLDELAERIDYARAHAESVGRRTPLTIACSLGGLAMETTAAAGEDLMVETAERLAGVGATYLYGGVYAPVETRAEFCAEVLRMGESLVPRLAAIEVADPLGTGETPR
jgi:probable F420-dependent oxidoreductase